MKKLLVISVYLLACLMVNAQKKSKAEGWIQLFNGKNLDGWTVKIKDHPVNDNFGNTFRVENGIIKVSYDQYGGEFKN